MKKTLLIALMVSPFIGFTQECGNYLFMTNNAEIEMTVLDKKGKNAGTQTWQITNVKTNGNSVESMVVSNFKDAKGNDIATGTGNYICENGILKADVRMSLPQQQMEAYKDAEINFDAVYLEYPYNISVGQTLNDADFKMDIRQENGMSSTVTYKASNRKVEGKESVTTPAGTWDAFIISYDATFRMEVAGIGIPMNIKGKEWFVPGVGVVKTETYNKNGKLTGSTMISAIKK